MGGRGSGLSAMAEMAQRLQIRFAAEGPLRYISHLDLMRMWERACKRAGLPLSHSRGFSPRPKIALAAPLAVGAVSECELLDLRLDERMDCRAVLERLEPQLPRGARVLEVSELPLRHPSLQSLVRAADYAVDAPGGRGADEWRAAIGELLARAEIPVRQERGGKAREFDLRALILGIELVEAGADGARLRMRLRNDERGAGRPELVLEALGGGAPTGIRRVALELEQPAVAAESTAG